MGAPFLAGVVAGYAIAIPVGAIAVLIVEQGLSRGFRPAFAAGAGAATADGVYATVAMVAGAAVAGAVGPIERPLRVAAAIVLLGIAAVGLVRLARDRAALAAAVPAPTRARGVYVRFTGLTLVNPQTVVYFAALILGLPDVLGTPAERIVFVAGAFLASLSWQTVLAAIGSIGHRRLGPGFRSALSLVGYVVIAGFAVAILSAAL